MRHLTPTRRRWLYRVSIAAIPLGVALGWLDVKTAALLVPLVVALLNVNDHDRATKARHDSRQV